MGLASKATYEDLMRHPAWNDVLVTLSARRMEYSRVLETEANTIEEFKSLQAAIGEIRFMEAMPQWVIDNYDKISEMEDTDE